MNSLLKSGLPGSVFQGSFALPTDLYTYHEADDTLELTVPNVTIADQGTYSCLYGNSTIYSFKVVHIGGKKLTFFITEVFHNYVSRTCFLLKIGLLI